MPDDLLRDHAGQIAGFLASANTLGRTIVKYLLLLWC